MQVLGGINNALVPTDEKMRKLSRARTSTLGRVCGFSACMTHPVSSNKKIQAKVLTLRKLKIESPDKSAGANNGSTEAEDFLRSGKNLNNSEHGHATLIIHVALPQQQPWKS